MERELVARLVVAGLPEDIVSALHARLEGCAVLEAANDAELRERIRDTPDVLVLGGWALGSDPVESVRRLRAGGLLAATKVACCLASPVDRALPARLVGEQAVRRLLLLPLDSDEALRQLAELAGVSVAAPPPSAPSASVQADKMLAGLAAAWARFREPTLHRVDVMEEAVLALLEGTLPDEQRAAAQREAHKLAGAAGTFGFPRSSHLARQIEERLALAGLTPADAVPLSEQLVALRADLEASPRAPDPQLAGAPATSEAQLLLVGAEAGLAERVESEGAARGLRVVVAADPEVALALARRAAPAVLAVCVSDGAHAAAALDLVETLTSGERAAHAVVLAPREATLVRVEAVRRGAQRFLELPASPAAIVSHALSLVAHAVAPRRRVLAVDDDPGILEVLRTVLGWSGREVHTVENPLLFWTALEDVRPDLLVLDVDMPHVTGIELARAVRSDPRWSNLPIIFLSARTDADTIRRAYAAGGDDHIGKPIVVEELMTRVRNRLERASAREEVPGDAASGVGTRAWTEDLLARYLHLARRRGDALSVAAVAVDDIASIAAAHGPAAVALAWRAAAQHLAHALRGEDVVGRWSDDEFVVVLYAASRADAAQRLSTLLATVARRELAAPNGASFRMRCTAGVAQFPLDGADVDALHAAASAARRRNGADGAAVALAGSNALASDGQSVDIVLVDDDEALVGLLEHALVTGGHRVHVYRDGETAAAGLLAEPPEVTPRVILLDVDLPGLNGLDLLRRLHRGGVTARSHVVMLTARAGEQDVLTALALGARDHVIKPFSVAVLLQKVRAALGDDA